MISREENWVAGIQVRETYFSLYTHFTFEFWTICMCYQSKKIGIIYLKTINFGRSISKMFLRFLLLGKSAGNTGLEKGIEVAE